MTVTVTVTASLVTETAVIIQNEKEIEDHTAMNKENEDKKDEKPKVEEHKPVTAPQLPFEARRWDDHLAPKAMMAENRLPAFQVTFLASPFLACDGSPHA